MSELEIPLIIEALLFSSEHPVSIEEILRVLSMSCPITKKELKITLQKMNEKYTEALYAFTLHETEEGYSLKTAKKYASYISLLHHKKTTERLSSASMETLAIIAYKQPITRLEIESIRGVDSSGVLHALQEKNLILIVGTKQAPGRPALFGTTLHFLSYMGISSIAELPPLTSYFS